MGEKKNTQTRSCSSHCISTNALRTLGEKEFFLLIIFVFTARKLILHFQRFSQILMYMDGLHGKWPLDAIKAVFSRRYLLQNCAIELYTSTGSKWHTSAGSYSLLAQSQYTSFNPQKFCIIIVCKFSWDMKMS